MTSGATNVFRLLPVMVSKAMFDPQLRTNFGASRSLTVTVHEHEFDRLAASVAVHVMPKTACAEDEGMTSCVLLSRVQSTVGMILVLSLAL
jgi:hypothetical protein